MVADGRHEHGDGQSVHRSSRRAPCVACHRSTSGKRAGPGGQPRSPACPTPPASRPRHRAEPRSCAVIRPKGGVTGVKYPAARITARPARGCRLHTRTACQRRPASIRRLRTRRRATRRSWRRSAASNQATITSHQPRRKRVGRVPVHRLDVGELRRHARALLAPPEVQTPRPPRWSVRSSTATTTSPPFPSSGTSAPPDLEQCRVGHSARTRGRQPAHTTPVPATVDGQVHRTRRRCVPHVRTARVDTG